jgi:hypothetical protein
MTAETPKVVSELEWRYLGDHWIAPHKESNKTDWVIKVWTASTFELRFGQRPYDQEMAFNLPTIDAAKALAQRLESVLSGDPECPINHTLTLCWYDSEDRSHFGEPKLRYAKNCQLP